MQPAMWKLALSVLVATLPGTTAARVKANGQNDAAGAEAGSGAISTDGHSQTGTKAAISALVGEMLEGHGPGIHDIVKDASGKINIEEAVHNLEGSLPDDVANLVRLSTQHKDSQSPTFSEASMQRARRILNGMIYDAWGELDDVVFECKEFQERNRGTYEQVVNDLARLGSQLASLGEKRVNSAAGIERYNAERATVEEQLEKKTQDYLAKRFKNARELTIRKNNLAVFDFILNLTACKDGQALLQTEPQHVAVCNTDDGVTLNFNNPQLQAQVERLMTPEARLALRQALGEAAGQFDLLQLDGGLGNTTSTTATPVAQETVPVVEEPHPAGQWKKCVDGEENCGLLHDLMSLQWGKFRDQVDRLTAEMTGNQQAFENDKKNFNEQLTVIGDSKTKFMEALAEAISNINSDTEEMNEKDEQKRDLTQEYEKMCAEFRAKITEILFTKMCAVKKVRNGLLIHSTKSPPSAINDCDVSDWESKTGECFSPTGQVITCDDSCPMPDPNMCGGKETMKRDVVVMPNNYGVACPPLERLKRCGQKKCEVACSMSSWSGWSKCSKDCEGGVEVKTRSILVRPKNGGSGCDSVQEERSCNTGSCDRDCTLHDWTDWAPCSMACGGGFTTHTRSVLVPIRGQGKCPRPKNRRRLQERECNTQACNGDEICIAQQDLILALDASGSVKTDGWDILRDFAVNLTTRYKEKYFGLEAVKIGVVLFGNGHLVTMPDGTTTITPALNVQPLTSNFSLVRERIAAQAWQRGFTNMAQALQMADTMLSQGGRESAQSAVLVLSDGKYSFRYQTAEKARELKDKNIQLFMAPVADFDFKELRILKRWASQPWETNYERVPGLQALKHNNELFIQRFVAKFCPDSISPSHMRTIEMQRNYMLIHENGWPSDDCGRWYYEGKVDTKDQCAELARGRDLKAFSFGRNFAVGRCYSEAIDITQQFWDEFAMDRGDPPCPSGSWLYNPYYDTYAINPSSSVNQ